MPSRRTLLVLVSGTLLLGGGSGLYLWQRHVQDETLRREMLPGVPTLTAWPAELRLQIETATRAVSRGENSAEALETLASLCRANGFLDEARRCYFALEATGEATALTRYRHALILAGYGEAEPAALALRQVLRDTPTYIPASIRLGDLLLKQGLVDEASEAFHQALGLDSEQPYALLGLARCAMERGEWTEARRHLEKVTALTQNRLGYDLIVTVYERLSLPDEAKALRARSKAQGTYRDLPDPWLDELIDLSCDPAQLGLAATTRKEAGDPAAARRLLDRALRFAPQDAKLHFQLALLLKEQRDFRGALPALQRCTELDPTFADGWVYLWDVLSELGQSAAARTAFATGLRHCPDSYGMNLMRARELKQAGQLRDAIPYFEKVIRLRPTEPDAAIDLALTHLALGQTEAALAAFHRALAAEPDHPLVLTTLAFHAIQSGQAGEARQWLERCQRQPRVSSKDLQQLTQFYRQTFLSP